MYSLHSIEYVKRFEIFHYICNALEIIKFKVKSIPIVSNYKIKLYLIIK